MKTIHLILLPPPSRMKDNWIKESSSLNQNGEDNKEYDLTSTFRTMIGNTFCKSGEANRYTMIRIETGRRDL